MYFATFLLKIQKNNNDITQGDQGIDYFYLRNQQGDITKIIDRYGNVVVEYQYDAWGNILYATDTALATINQYTYRGYRYDSEINLYYLNSRFYDPVIGRFINSDGLLGSQGNILGHNMYAYTQNNPVMYSDISGYAPKWWEDYVSWVESGYEAIGRTAYGQWIQAGYKSIGKELSQEFMVDISYSGRQYKFGVSFIINLEDEYFEFYPHGGRTWGIKTGPSVSFGVVDNYSGPGDYSGVFAYAEAGYFVGVGHCLSPFDLNNGARAFYIEIGIPNVSIGIDYYFRQEWMVFDWSGR